MWFLLTNLFAVCGLFSVVKWLFTTFLQTRQILKDDKQYYELKDTLCDECPNNSPDGCIDSKCPDNLCDTCKHYYYFDFEDQGCYRREISTEETISKCPFYSSDEDSNPESNNRDHLDRNTLETSHY